MASSEVSNMRGGGDRHVLPLSCFGDRNDGGDSRAVPKISDAARVDADVALYKELWRACAGPLITVPQENELVFYFPQGHLEQSIAAVLGKDVLGPAICKYSVVLMKLVRSRIVERYDSETGAWEMLPSLLMSRKMSSGVMMHGELYVIGSSGKDGKALLCGTGSMAPPLLAVVANELYAADCLAMKVKKYNKVKSIWVNIGRLPERANSMGRWGISFIHGMWGHKGTPS
ncbi:F-box/kelch-repeat protein SKIP11-like protein [Tanacetum coccineum]